MSIILGGVLLGEGLFLVETMVTVAVSPFVMVLFGVFLILTGLLGAYVSNSSQLAILIFYEIFSAVIMTFLLLWAAFCFYQISLVDDSVDRHWDRLRVDDDDVERTPEEEEELKDSAASVFKSWLLVTGILETVLAFFQLVNFLAAHGLFKVPIFTLTSQCAEAG
jgi:hypothetical protein